ncbi:MAG TPA: RdgB/HAM1 family non-canonical purine NTP pyrophosphatase [Thermoleophilia bacterium]|nr:RdgB/HAM1 family non-canonical purine NTP pyrophosphatase [Thermoleophilia bacterium]
MTDSLSSPAADGGCARVVVATRNQGKAREFARLLGRGFSVETLPAGVGLPEETGATFAENALLKALGAYVSLGAKVAVLADDSGLEVDALAGEPGVRSARYAGDDATDEQNVALLLERLGGTAERAGRFVCALALVTPSRTGGAPQLHEVTGVLEGRIAAAPAGGEGFGYDPVFVPEGWDLTLGEGTAFQKDAVSHRARAVASLLDLLEREGVRIDG